MNFFTPKISIYPAKFPNDVFCYCTHSLSSLHVLSHHCTCCALLHDCTLKQALQKIPILKAHVSTQQTVLLYRPSVSETLEPHAIAYFCIELVEFVRIHEKVWISYFVHQSIDFVHGPFLRHGVHPRCVRKSTSKRSHNTSVETFYLQASNQNICKMHV